VTLDEKVCLHIKVKLTKSATSQNLSLVKTPLLGPRAMV